MRLYRAAPQTCRPHPSRHMACMACTHIRCYFIPLRPRLPRSHGALQLLSFREATDSCGPLSETIPSSSIEFWKQRAEKRLDGYLSLSYTIALPQQQRSISHDKHGSHVPSPRWWTRSLLPLTSITGRRRGQVDGGMVVSALCTRK